MKEVFNKKGRSKVQIMFLICCWKFLQAANMMNRAQVLRIIGKPSNFWANGKRYELRRIAYDDRIHWVYGEGAIASQFADEDNEEGKFFTKIVKFDFRIVGIGCDGEIFDESVFSGEVDVTTTPTDLFTQIDWKQFANCYETLSKEKQGCSGNIGLRVALWNIQEQATANVMYHSSFF